MSGRFPPSYAGYVMTGQAMGGVLPAIVAIALVTLDVQPRLLGPACFVAILLFIIVAFALFYIISKNRCAFACGNVPRKVASGCFSPGWTLV